MQDFTTYNYNITIEELKKTIDLVPDIIVIINGEYYNLIKDKKNKENRT